MRLARIGDTGGERPAVWDGTTWRDLTALTDDLDAAFIATGLVLRPRDVINTGTPAGA